MKPKVVVTRILPPEAMGMLTDRYEVVVWPEEDLPASRDFLEHELHDAHALLCLLTDRIDKELLSKAQQLKAISTMAVGYNHIDIQAARGRGITVTNTPDILTETTADLAFTLLLATARRVVEASDFLRHGKWQTWSPMLLTGQDVFGATLGIFGMGRIGEAVVRRALGFNMKVLYHNRSRKPDAENQYGITYATKQDLLEQSDFVLILTPYSSETANMIRYEHLTLMKPTACLINVARGGIVNETDLYQALVDKRIWAAGLDVFDVEPVRVDHPLLSLDNVVTLPHIGSASISTRKKMAALAAANIVEILSDRPPLSPVT